MKSDLTKIINQNEINHVATEPLSCPPLETLPNKNNPVDCFCERKPKSLISRRGRKRAAFTLAEGRLACTTTQATAKAAFTLAEVLITLAIIGVVAVLTIPALIKNYNEKAWSTAQSVFEKRLEVAVKQLNTEEKLAGYSSTMDFVNELKNKIKITKVCDSSHLTDCFAKSIVNASGVEYDISELASSRFTKENWGTETVGVQFANGINALIAYNPNTEQDPYNNQFGATAESMAILYDVSGYKNPNTIGKDINMNGNVKALGCMIKPELLDGMCINQILAPGTGYSPMTYDECRQAVEEGTLGIPNCNPDYADNDYWAGAVKACGGRNKLPTMADLTTIASYLYGVDVASSGQTSAPIDSSKATIFWPNMTNQQEGIFSSEPFGSGRLGVFNRQFYKSNTYATSITGCPRSVSTQTIVCLE